MTPSYDPSGVVLHRGSQWLSRGPSPASSAMRETPAGRPPARRGSGVVPHDAPCSETGWSRSLPRLNLGTRDRRGSESRDACFPNYWNHGQNGSRRRSHSIDVVQVSGIDPDGSRRQLIPMYAFTQTHSPFGRSRRLSAISDRLVQATKSSRSEHGVLGQTLQRLSIEPERRQVAVFPFLVVRLKVTRRVFPEKRGKLQQHRFAAAGHRIGQDALRCSR